MPVIVCTLNLFTINQHVLIYGEDPKKPMGSHQVTLYDLPRFLAQYSHDLQINKIHLVGHEGALDSIIQATKEYGLKNYSNTNLEFEVN